MTIKGHVLRPGGTIGVPAPASAYHNRSEVLRGVEWWEGQGYKVKLGRNIFARDAYVAGSPEGRAQDLMDMFTDDEVDVVHCFQGGYGSAQTIEHLDFDAIRANPKALIGYSDITALHTALRHYTGLITFYGPGLAGVNDRETKKFTQERLLRALTTEGSLGEVPRELGFNLYEPTPEAIEEFDAPETSTGNPALLDPLVREAINWSIDEEELTQKILQGEGIPGSTLVPPALARYHLKLDESEIQGFDTERSRELLEEAGWEDTNGDGTVDKGGEELELRLFVRSEDKDSVTAGQFIEDWFEEAGIGLETKAISDTALTDAIYAADYDMFIWGWGSEADPDFILSVLTCDQLMGWSDTFWCNDDYSRMYQEQKEQLDIDERAATIKEMQRIAYEDNPYVIFYYDNQFEAWRTDRLEGWTKTPTTADPGQVAFTFSTKTYMNLRPLSSTDETGGGGTSPLVYVGLALVGVAVITAVVVLLRRRSAEDRA